MEMEMKKADKVNTWLHQEWIIPRTQNTGQPSTADLIAKLDKFKYRREATIYRTVMLAAG